MVQLAGGVTAFQFNPIALEEDAVAVSPVAPKESHCRRDYRSERLRFR